MSAEPKPEDNLQLLKQLVLGDEQKELEVLRSRLDELEEESIERLARDIAEAIKRRQDLGDDAFDDFVAALQSGTESAIQRSVSEDKSKLSKALFPIMGPAIRTYVVDLFRGMVEELNEAIKNTTSVERLKWRAQAKLAGKSYSEYVMLKTRSFRIEEAYVIQRDTGLLLLHSSIDPEKEQHGEVDMMSGMFMAIRNFVRDSPLGLEDEEAGDDAYADDDTKELDHFSFGEKEVLIEAGPSMVLAAVSKGVPPPPFRDELKGILEDLHGELQDDLDRFSGDMSEMEEGRPVLRRALVESKGAQSGGGLWRAWVVIGTLAVGLGTWIYFDRAEQSRWDRFEASLDGQPGITVTGVSGGGILNRRVVKGIRDQFAATPEEFAAAYEANDDPGFRAVSKGRTSFRFNLVESLDPEIVTRREALREEEKMEVEAKLNGLEEGVSGARSSVETGLSGVRTEVAAVKDDVTGVKTDMTGAKADFEAGMAEIRAMIEAEIRERESQSRQVLKTLVRSQFGDVEGLTIEFPENGQIVFRGSVVEPDYSSLQGRLEPLKSMGAVNTAELKNGTLEKIAALVEEIGSTSIPFQSGTLDQEDAAQVDRLCELTKELESAGAVVGVSYDFVVTAHPLIGANRAENRVIETSRADEIRDRLIRKGIPPGRIRARLSEDGARQGAGVSIVPIVNRPAAP